MNSPAAKKRRPGSAGGNNAPNSVDGMTEEMACLLSPDKIESALGEESDVESDDVDADEDYSPFDFDDPSTYILDADEDADEDMEILEDLIQSSPSSHLESSLDIDDGDSKKSANYESVDTVGTAGFDFRGGEFKERYNALAAMNLDDCNGATKAIVGLVQYVENCDVSQFTNDALVASFNKERDDIGRALNEACPDLAVNLGSAFSLLTSIVFYLHYAPKGCKLVYLWNYCADNQCCIHTMKSKLPNFLINEHEFGSDVMENWRFGGKTDLDESSRMAVVDLIPILLEKKESDSEMREQYKEIADKLGLDSYFDLMAISYCLVRMHSLLFQKRNRTNEKLQIHVASSATAWHIFGLKGTAKYSRKIWSQTYCLTFGFHPQGWLMGIGKREAVYPKPLLEKMARTLIGVYQSVFPKLDNMHESRIFEIFGCKQSSIELKWYNIGAKALDEKGLLDLDTRLEANATAQAVRAFLSRRGVSNDIISWFTREMEGASTLSTIMDRIRNCRAAHRLLKWYNIGAKALDEKGLLDLDTRLEANATAQAVRAFLSRRGVSNDIISFLTREVEGASTLSTIMDRIRNCRATHRLLKWYNIGAKALDEKGLLDLDTRLEANATAQAVRAFLSRRGVSNDIISWFTREMEGASTLSTIMDRIRKFRAAHRLQYIAILLPKGVSSLDGLSGELKCSIKAISLTLKQPQELVFQRVLKHAEKSTCLSLRHQLAKLLNDACSDDDDEDGRALENHEDFKTYCRISGLDSAVLMQRVKNTAMSYNKTFWRNYQKLEQYRTSFSEDIVRVDNVPILTVDITRGDGYSSLYKWMNYMNGYLKSVRETEGKYGLEAYMKMGSVEQIALSKLDVSFDPELNKRAITQRIEMRMASRLDRSGSKRTIMNFLNNIGE